MKTAKNELPYLEPIISDWMKLVIQDKSSLQKLIDRYGSPINLHNPEMLTHNASLFKQVLEKEKVAYKIFFARKPNKCIAYVKEAKKSGIGIDTASYHELLQALDVCLPEDIIFTAAIKEEKALRLAITKNVTIIADNYDELATIQKIAKKLGKKQKIGIRLSGFIIEGKKLYSRFGFDIHDVGNIFKKLLTAEFSNVLFSGFHFHLNGYSVEERAVSVLSILEIVEDIKRKGFITKFIDIGGGFPICYLTSESQWNTFENELKNAVLEKREPITFFNNGLGFLNYKGLLVGKENYYPFFNTNNKEKFLKSILVYKKNKKSIFDRLRESGIELRFEPGRSLLDQCGMTVARIAFRKKDQNNDWLIGLEMNMTQLMSSSMDFLVDPIIVYNNPSKKTEKTSGYFVGAYCLERDIILKRKIPLEKLPEVGDLVCFINTAGYMMHFFESRSHQFDLAKNFIMKVNKKTVQYTLENDIDKKYYEKR